MPINIYQIYIPIPCNKSIVCFIHKLYYILEKNVVLCITLPCRRGSRPDGARTPCKVYMYMYIIITNNLTNHKQKCICSDILYYLHNGYKTISLRKFTILCKEHIQTFQD